jgi:predicted Zn-dependent peptidase
MKHSLLLFFLLGPLCLAYSQEKNIQFEEFTLDNGLEVLLHQDNSTPIVALAVMYHVGSKNEDPSRTGFAHFFEHLLFEGSENIERGQFAQYIQDAGGTLNAYTTPDVTCYFEVLPSNQLQLGMWLESERMLHARVDDEGIETQREVVKEEMRMRYDNRPYGTFQREILKRAYQKYPYKWPTIGSMEHLNAASEEDYVKFYKTYYVPNNAVLVVTGDIDVPEAKKMVKKYFGTIPKGKGLIYRPTMEEPALGGEVRDTILDEVQLPGVFQAYRTPPLGNEDFYAVNMVATLLSKGESSRFQRALVDEQGKAVAVGNFVLDLEGPGIAIGYAISSAGVDASEVEAAMNAEIERVQNELISEEEFQKLRNQMESDFIQDNTTMFGIANNLATYKTLYGDANLINTELERYMNVSREDIQKAAKQYFSKDNRVSLHYLPKPVKP